jgi:Phage integrase, N-terminal SAM-like domain
VIAQSRSSPHALAAETSARQTYGRADLAADGSLAAELEVWLGERELDVAGTTLSNYRDIVTCYIVPHLGSRPVYALNSRAINDLYKTLIKRGGKNGRPLSRTTVRTVHWVLMKALADLRIAIDGVRKPRREDRETQRITVSTRPGCWPSWSACAAGRCSG